MSIMRDNGEQTNKIAYRIFIQNVENGFEIASHVSFNDLSDIGFLFDVDAKSLTL